MNYTVDVFNYNIFAYFCVYKSYRIFTASAEKTSFDYNIFKHNRTITYAITYDEVLAQHLAVMDTTATSLSMDNHIPVLLFALKEPENIIRVLKGEKIGTIVKE